MPRKVQVVQLKTQQHQRTDSSDEFYEASRQEQRYIRIRDRVPTGHPGLVQRVNEVHRELAEMEGNISDTASSVSAEVTTKHSKKSSSTKKDPSSSSSKKKEKHSSDSKQRDREREREREKKKKERPPAPPVESSDEESVEPEVLVKTVKVPSKKKKSKPEKARVGIEKATVIGKDDDDGWNDKKRSQVRSTRINNRRPTGHPQLAKKLAPQLRKLEMNSAEDSDDISAQAAPAAASRHQAPSSEEDTEASPPKRRGGDKEKREKSSKRDKERSSRDKDRDRRGGEDEISSRKKKSKDAIKFGDARPVDEDSDGSWEEEERKETRFNRIRTRVPTGHPGLAKRLLESKMLNELEDDDDDDEESEEEVVVKVKSSSKSSRHKSSSKSSSKTRV